MGRIKTTLIKRNTKKLVKESSDKLGTEFKANKNAIKNLAVISSKKLRNIVAGYTTRLMKKKKADALQ
ncbi:MAG TPA: 30S ribosomal protein S17e [Nanoarchaeota archaeon]|nr:30S ribosomal protein S17e [Nanoarchaeota archaeon]